MTPVDFERHPLVAIAPAHHEPAGGRVRRGDLLVVLRTNPRDENGPSGTGASHDAIGISKQSVEIQIGQHQVKRPGAQLADRRGPEIQLGAKSIDCSTLPGTLDCDWIMVDSQCRDGAQTQSYHSQNPASGSDVEHALVALYPVFQPFHQQLGCGVMAASECPLGINHEFDFSGSVWLPIPALPDQHATADPDGLDGLRPDFIPVLIMDSIHAESGCGLIAQPAQRLLDRVQDFRSPVVDRPV